MLKAFRSAWRHTLPILAGYVFLGFAFGFQLRSAGFPVWYPIFMSVFIYSGALEYAAIPLLSEPFNPAVAFLMGLMLSARHLFYGIPMLKKYENSGFMRIPLIFTLTDESFSVCSSLDVPEGIEGRYFYGSISLLNYFYWIAGTAAGALFGAIVSFDTTGIDFALTALFIVLFLEQARTREGVISGGIGLAAALASLLIFGPDRMVIVSMIVIAVALFAAKKVISRD